MSRAGSPGSQSSSVVGTSASPVVGRDGEVKTYFSACWR